MLRFDLCAEGVRPGDLCAEGVLRSGSGPVQAGNHLRALDLRSEELLP